METGESNNSKVAAEAKARARAKGQGAGGKQLLDAFGEKGGVYYAQGKTFEQARELHVADLAKRVQDLEVENQRLKGLLHDAGEIEPTGPGQSKGDA